jgi:hypothetical protein
MVGFCNMSPFFFFIWRYTKALLFDRSQIWMSQGFVNLIVYCSVIKELDHRVASYVVLHTLLRVYMAKTKSAGVRSPPQFSWKKRKLTSDLENMWNLNFTRFFSRINPR